MVLGKYLVFGYLDPWGIGDYNVPPSLQVESSPFIRLEHGLGFSILVRAVLFSMLRLVCL